MSTSRNYGIDLFRIVSMLMVVMLHVLGQGGVLDASENLFNKHATMFFLETACYGAVNCFALISGYVGLKSKHRYKNIAMLWLQVIFLTVVLQILQFAIDPTKFNFKLVLSSFLPVLTRKYWYFTDYFILLFLMPIFNVAVMSLKKEHLLRIIICCGSLFSITSFFPGYQLNNDPFQLHMGYSILWLMLLYLIGAYINKYPPLEKIKSKWFLVSYFLLTLLAYVSKIFCDIFPRLYVFFSETALVSYHSPLILLGSVSLLIYFSRITLTKSWLCTKIVYVSSLCFGVYIIHCHPLFWSLLKNLFAPFVSYPVYLLIGVVIGATLAIFALCALLEAMRACLFKRLKIKQYLSKLECKLSAKE